MTLGAYDHQDVPFERLVDELGVARDRSRTPLFQAMFVLQNLPQATISLGDLRAEPLRQASATAKFDLTLTATERPDGGLGLFLEHATDLFEEASAARLLARYARFLAAATAAPATTGDQPAADHRGRACRPGRVERDDDRLPGREHAGRADPRSRWRGARKRG